jgi:hypothetical protein
MGAPEPEAPVQFVYGSMGIVYCARSGRMKLKLKPENLLFRR